MYVSERDITNSAKPFLSTPGIKGLKKMIKDRIYTLNYILSDNFHSNIFVEYINFRIVFKIIQIKKLSFFIFRQFTGKQGGPL